VATPVDVPNKPDQSLFPRPLIPVHTHIPVSMGAASELLTGDELQPKLPQTLSGHQLRARNSTLGTAMV